MIATILISLIPAGFFVLYKYIESLVTNNLMLLYIREWVSIGSFLFGVTLFTYIRIKYPKDKRSKEILTIIAIIFIVIVSMSIYLYISCIKPLSELQCSG